ncbi:MAG: TolB family protein, partial [bacterium]
RALYWSVILGSRETLSWLVNRYLSSSSKVSLTTEDLYPLAAFVGISPFHRVSITEGWDGVYSTDGKNIIFIRQRGSSDDPDPYFYIKDRSTGIENPLMKAYQQGLWIIAKPFFSSDSKTLYFFGSTEKGAQLGIKGMFYLYEVEPRWGAEGRRISDPDILPILPFPTAKGTLLAVRRDLGSVRASVEVVEIDPKKRSKTTVIRIGEPVITGCFTPQGDSLMFITERGLMKRALTGGGVVVDLEWKRLNLCYLSPDGRWLLLGRQPQDLYLIDRINQKVFFLGEWTTSQFSIWRKTLLITFKEGGKLRLWEYDLSRPMEDLALLKEKLQSL